MDCRLILDTDIDTDCDDAGTLAMLHGLMRRGEVELLGVVCSVPVHWCAACVHAANAWYGRADIPVGLVAVPDWETNPAHAAYRAARAQGAVHVYNEDIGRSWEAAHGTVRPEEAVALYRRLLAEQPDGSVTICAIGMLTALAQLLQSGPDEHSPLPGQELVTRKVARLVTMAIGSFPRGRDVFNWAMDRPATHLVLERWPTPVVVSEWGETVLTGARFIGAAPEDHPLRRAYQIWLGAPSGSRSSWDQLAALYAVRGADGMFRERWGYRCRFDKATGDHEWVPAAGATPQHCHLTPAVDDATLAQAIEDLMVDSL
ncbi:MAG: hypothetical protein HPY69_08465 [Armatimonadetes bacterium]|nr:hypothetical protein [Armatimonadota bacterium]